MAIARLGTRLARRSLYVSGLGSCGSRLSRQIYRTMANRADAAAIARDIFAAALDAVRVDRLVKQVLQVPAPGQLSVNGAVYELRRNVTIVAFGKAVLGMVRAAEDVLGDHVRAGVASVPLGLCRQLAESGGSGQHLLPRPGSVVKVIEGARNNVPDLAANGAAEEIVRLLQDLNRDDDIVLTLISGGGSALLPLPVPPVQLQDVLDITVALSRAGATITELNAVRKQLELLKGGGLASLARPAKVISLILSDIVGDPLDFIASGPTVPDVSTSQDAIRVIFKYVDPSKVPPRVLELLRTDGKAAELRRLGDEKLARQSVSDTVESSPPPHNVIVGTNAYALEAAAQRARSLGLECAVLTRELQGEARVAGELFARLGMLARRRLLGSRDPAPPPPSAESLLLPAAIGEQARAEVEALAAAARAARASRVRGLCLLAGGETTVTVRGRGRGGRNQEMALAAAIEMAEAASGAGSCEAPIGCVALLSAGTDGQDGPTDAAGACVDVSVGDARVSGRDARAHLDDNDSHTFLSRVDGGAHLVRTGLTGTNVMDVQVLVTLADDDDDQ